MGPLVITMVSGGADRITQTIAAMQIAARKSAVTKARAGLNPKVSIKAVTTGTRFFSFGGFINCAARVPLTAQREAAFKLTGRLNGRAAGTRVSMLFGDQKKDVKMFKSRARDADDAAVGSFASSHVATFQKAPGPRAKPDREVHGRIARVKIETDQAIAAWSVSYPLRKLSVFSPSREGC